MKYKVGDKVRIKGWKDMEKEYGTFGSNSYFINCSCAYSRHMEKELLNFNKNRIVVIKKIVSVDLYRMKEIPTPWDWSNDMIECLAKDYVELIPILSRFEILDL